ncbi:MAG: hypothetical protein FJX11_13485 [Alphaproteobacteria bacterium]|nr:hypothetical protein [Alphaproteobacteria bacterium]
MNAKSAPDDPIGPWFAAGESLGEFIGIPFGWIPPGAAAPEWTYLSHSEVDGIGGFARILRERGAMIDALPQLQYGGRSSISPFLKALAMRVVRYDRWRGQLHWQLSQSTTAEARPRSLPPIAWHVFDKADTLRLRQHCRRAGITVNTLLLKDLTQAIRPYLQDRAAEVPWFLPVNMRGEASRKSDTVNCVSYVSVKVRAEEGIQMIHKKVLTALERKEHWANWYVACVAGRMLSHEIKKFLWKHEQFAAEWNIGVFSNIGEWDAEEKVQEPACLGEWVFCPPAFSALRVAAGVVTFQNRLGLAMQAHPSLTNDPTILRAWMDAWIGGIEASLADTTLP